MVFEIHAWHAVVCVRKQERIIETNLKGAGLHVAVPIDPCSTVSQAQVPFADDGRLVAGLLKKLRQGEHPRFDHHGCIRRQDAHLMPKPMNPGKQREPRGRACGGCTVTVREVNSLAGKRVDVGRGNQLRPVDANIRIAHVVAIDKHHVRPGRICFGNVGLAAFLCGTWKDCYRCPSDKRHDRDVVEHDLPIILG